MLNISSKPDLMNAHPNTQPVSKLILVIVRGGDRDTLLQALLEAQYRVTEIASMGGFFHRQSTTLLIGAADGQVEQALTLIREQCPTPPNADEHRATIFVLKAASFITI
jgi:uncharacterized protein YaaQ